MSFWFHFGIIFWIWWPDWARSRFLLFLKVRSKHVCFIDQSSCLGRFAAEWCSFFIITVPKLVSFDECRIPAFCCCAVSCNTLSHFQLLDFGVSPKQMVHRPMEKELVQSLISTRYVPSPGWVGGKYFSTAPVTTASSSEGDDRFN